MANATATFTPEKICGIANGRRIFRNVFSRNKFYEKVTCDGDDRQPFFKSGSDASFGDGRRYIFHNTMLQPTQSGCSYGLGGGAGIGGTGSAQLINNTFSMNNIYHLWKPNSAFYQVGSGNLFQNDMFNGSAVVTQNNNYTATWQAPQAIMPRVSASSPERMVSLSPRRR